PRALVWVGDYDNTKCAWEVSDLALTRKISAMAGDVKVAGYYFSDEPNPDACPNAPAEHKARSGLIHTLDPGKLAIMAMDSNSGQASLNQIPRWVGVADYVALDPYPCYQRKPCNYPWIDASIAAAETADEVHYTFTGPTSIAFDWRGTAKTIRYGRTSRYGRTVRAHLATPAPFSSAGPFWEARLSRLKRGTSYHYSIGGGPDQTM